MKKKGFLFQSAPNGIKELMEVALGKAQADMAVINAKLVNVFTGEIMEGQSVCIKKQKIAYVGKNPGNAIGDSCKVIDAGGKVLVPGFIDGHTHLGWYSSPAAFLEYAMKGGTTAIITETLEAYPVCGRKGVMDFIESLRDQPIKIFATAPPMVSTSQVLAGIDSSDLKLFLEQDDVLGLGESYWQAVLQQPELFLPPICETLKYRKSIEGHSAGASEKKLNAYIAAGISSCHEPINADEVLDRLRLGLHVMVREGSIRRDLKEIAKITDTGAELRRLILVSDGVEPEDLMEKGYMEYIVQKAIDSGFDPVTAIQMTTLNVAEHFGLDGFMGAIAPGRYADMVILPDLYTIKAEIVISNGKIIAKHGELLEPPRIHAFLPENMDSINLPKKITAEDFAVKTKNKDGFLKVRVINMVTDLVTREILAELKVDSGEILSDPDMDIMKVAAIDRTLSSGKIFTGFIKGFGLKQGALACSASWDTSCIIVVGENENDMADAVNRIRELKGGAVVCANGRIIGEIAMPVFGIMADMPLKDIAKGLAKVRRAAAGIGVPFHDPLLSLTALTGAAIPFIRICEQGLVSLKDGKTLALG